MRHALEPLAVVLLVVIALGSTVFAVRVGLALLPPLSLPRPQVVHAYTRPAHDPATDSAAWWTATDPTPAPGVPVWETADSEGCWWVTR